MGEIKFMKALVFISLFAIAITGYAIGFANDNGAVVSIDPDAEFSGINSTTQSSANDFYLNTNDSSTSFFASTITGAEQTTVTGGEFKLGLGSLIETINSISKTTRKTLFGNNPAFGIIFTLFSSFLIYMGVRYIWKTWKGGNPD